MILTYSISSPSLFVYLARRSVLRPKEQREEGGEGARRKFGPCLLMGGVVEKEFVREVKREVADISLSPPPLVLMILISFNANPDPDLAFKVNAVDPGF
jgi:hypothetical protein